MINHYTVENTAYRGIRVEATINGTKRDFLTEIWQIGPFVLAWGLMKNTAGNFVIDKERDRIAPRLHLGFGRVTVSAR